mgnify:FL=1
MMADLMAEALHEGYWDLTVAAIPEAWGQAIDVPESMLKGGDVSASSVASSVTFEGHAARMSTPGAAISGCKRIGIKDINSIADI